MDLQTIDDVDKLKALGFDEIAKLEQAQANLRAINIRLQQIAVESEEEE